MWDNGRELLSNLFFLSFFFYMKAKGLFGFSISITYNSVFITHNSKMVGPMVEKSIWIFITLFPVFVFITQFSNFWVMSYGNWKHILSVFSFHNSIFNGILIIKHTWRDPLIKVNRNFWPFFSFYSTIIQLFFLLFFFFFLFTLVSSFFLFFFSFFFFFFVLHHMIYLVFAQLFLSFSSSFTRLCWLGFFFFSPLLFSLDSVSLGFFFFFFFH